MLHITIISHLVTVMYIKMKGRKNYSSLTLCTLFFISSVNSDLVEDSFKNVVEIPKNETVLDIFKTHFYDYRKSFCDVSLQNLTSDATCTKQLEYICERNDVLTQMLDASSKYSGMLFGKRIDYGNYDQCLAIDHEYEYGTLMGKFCPLSFLIPDPQTGFTKAENIFQLSICIPDGCSLKHFFNVSDHLSEELITQKEASCVTKDSGKELGIGNIVTMSLFLAWFALVMICTFYEVCLYYMGKECYHQTVTSFSLKSNFKKLFDVKKKSKGHMEIFDGIRAISMTWIIAFHGYTSRDVGLPESNGMLEQFRRTIESSHIFGSPLAVDSFFFISGFFVALSYLKHDTKPLKQQIYSIPSLYLKRYVRLTASLFFVYLSVVWIIPKIGDGPLWIPRTTEQAETCKKYWWAFFIYIQNYYNYEHMCIVPSWYLSVDMQLFILSPIVLIPLSILLKQKGKVMLSMVLLVMLNILLTILPIILNYNIKAGGQYFATHLRIIDYTIGITMGTLMYSFKDIPYLPFIPKKNVKITSFLLWATVLFGMYFTMLFYVPYKYTTNPDFKALYPGLSRPVWCIGLCWIIYSCYNGYGGFINWILTADVLKVFSKLSYTMYLLHTVVITHFTNSVRTRVFFSNYHEFHLFCGYFIETLLVSILFTLVFDYPIEKLLLQKLNKVVKEKGGKKDIK